MQDSVEQVVLAIEERPREAVAQQVAGRLAELAAEFAGWRFGRGGSGNWWAVRGNDLVRSMDVEELRARLVELCSVPS